MTVQTVEAAGVALCVESTGTGAPVLLVHGIATDRSLWLETVAALDSGLRAIAYDRRAYGASGSPEPYGGTTVAEQADDACALIRALAAAPALLCGHGLGALICLDVLIREPALARAAVLIDPPMLWLSPEGPDVTSAMRAAIERGAREDGAAGAVDAFLEDAFGSGALELLGPTRLERSHAAARAFAADLSAASTWPAGRRELRAIEAPVTLLVGTSGPPILGEVAAALARLMPAALVRELHDARLPPIDAPSAVGSAIEALSRR
ncbi:MAG: hypothetical protein NVSMB25_04310 [Thermoleophilaceae bacterium]